MNKNKKVAFHTLGCKVNSYDTEAMAECFEKAGYEVVAFTDFADVYVINTCTVTHLGDRKSRGMMRRAKRTNPAGIIVAAGCYVQVAPEEVATIEEVDLMIGNKNRAEIVAYIEAFKADHEKNNFVSDILREHDFEELSITETKGKTRAFLKVQEGCSQFCTYCIVPFARGPVRSRSPEKTVEEVRRLVENGYFEVVLTGIHIASYGKDLEGDITLLTLIQQISEIPGVKRIRLSSLEPLLLTEEFVQGLSEIPQFCPHFHLSLQSGSDTVLLRMGRHYTTSEYAEIVARIRRYFELPAITTDIMVGFPGETEAEFEETLNFVKQIGFYQVHVFKYSKRRGTKAAAFPDQVDETVKHRRSQKLTETAKACEVAFLLENHGRSWAVLFEQTKTEGVYEGHTPNYIPVKVNTETSIDGKIKEVSVFYKESPEPVYFMTGTLNEEQKERN